MEAKQLKAELMKEMEAEIDQLVESYKHSGPLTMTQLEDLLLAARQRMGQKLAERLIALQEQEVAAPIKQVRCCARRVKKVTVTSRLGKVTYERAYYYDPEERRGYYPFDQQLGVKGGISEGVVRIVVKLSAHMPYQAARDVYEEVAGVAVSVGEIWNLTQAAGQRSRSALQPLPTMKETLESAACVVWTDLWRMFVLKGGRR